MNIEANRIVQIEDEYLSDFKFKSQLSEVEFYGLENILAQLLGEYNEECFGEKELNKCIDTVDRYTIHRTNCLDVLDGVYDVIHVFDYSISSMYLTENNIVVLKCIKLDEDFIPLEDSHYFASLN